MSRKNNIKYTPTNIANYNKFLMNLDNKFSTKKNDIEISDNKNDLNDLHDSIKINKQLDELINTISNNFYANYLYSNNFTGLKDCDIYSKYIEIKDPNTYEEPEIRSKVIKRKVVRNNPDKPLTPKKIEINTLDKEFIHIDKEINNIDDLLDLINKYDLKPNVRYNIDMAALHRSKDYLIKLNNMIGMQSLKTNIVDQILYFLQGLHKNKNLSGDYMHTIIYGPPGTGKTEIAKIIGKIYSKIGILEKGTFQKVTRSDLIAGYLGQTALKTRDVIKDAIGGVLFIDEAYALGNSEKRDSFSKECIDTLCEALSDNKDNLMVIIAGYEKELKECFFNYNPGLESRFVWRFKTDEYNGEDLYNIFVKKVNEIGWCFHEDSNINSLWFKKNLKSFAFYGRDIETLLSKIKIMHSKRVFCKDESEKKKLVLKDLEKGFELYLKNDEIKNREEKEEFQKYLSYTLYS